MSHGRDAGFVRVPLLVQFDETPMFPETYGFSGSQGIVSLEGQLLRPKERESRTVLLFMHPTSLLNLLPLPVALADAGFHVMCCGSRYLRNDTTLIMEKVACDLGAYVRYAKHQLGYERVVLVGWSGGGALSLFYQAEAEHPTVVSTPAGDPLDLGKAGLVPADGMVLIATNFGRAALLAEWIDPSVQDELRPDMRDMRIDLYSGPVRPPYSADFVNAYRAGQLERMRRITTWVRESLDDLRRRKKAHMERCFLVHRTMADPRFLDGRLEPNDRRVGWCYLGDPEVVNVGPVGLARFRTLRSWLSQWSIDDSRAHATQAAKRVTVPSIVIENTADDCCPASHAPAIFEALGSERKEMERVVGANHYYSQQPDKARAAVHKIANWLYRYGLVAEST